MTIIEAAKKQYDIKSQVPADLVKPLFDWVWKDDREYLELEYKHDKKLFANLDKGMEHTELYRVASFTNEQFRKLLTGKPVRWRGALESWTWDRKILDTFLRIHKTHARWEYSVVFKKTVPEQDRILCVACLDPAQFEKICKDWSTTTKLLAGEKEIICKRQAYNRDDIVEIFYTDGDGKQEKKNLAAFLPDRETA